MTRRVSSTVRWVILHHTNVDPPHYDLMYEHDPGSALEAWRLPEWPPRRYVVCTPLPRHRREYLEYEGPISGDRGIVRRIASGECIVETLTEGQEPYHVELAPAGMSDRPFVILELGENGWVAVPVDPKAPDMPIGRVGA